LPVFIDEPDELQTLVTECLRGPLPDLPQILRKTSHRAGTAV